MKDEYRVWTEKITKQSFTQVSLFFFTNDLSKRLKTWLKTNSTSRLRFGQKRLKFWRNTFVPQPILVLTMIQLVIQSSGSLTWLMAVWVSKILYFIATRKKGKELSLLTMLQVLQYGRCLLLSWRIYLRKFLRIWLHAEVTTIQKRYKNLMFHQNYRPIEYWSGYHPQGNTFYPNGYLKRATCVQESLSENLSWWLIWWLINCHHLFLFHIKIYFWIIAGFY